MNLKLIYDIASSLLLARWRQTLVAATGVTFGITMFIALLSFMGGLNKLLDSLVTNRTPHVRLYNQLLPAAYQPVKLWPAYRQYYHFIASVKPQDKKLEIKNSRAVIAALGKDQRVAGIAPKLEAQVFYNVGTTALPGLVNGIDARAEGRLFAFKDYLIAGNESDLTVIPNSIILGKGAADKMLANTGDVIQLTSAEGHRMQLKVVGFYQSGLQEIDDVQSYVSVATAQRLLDEPAGYITDIQVKLKDIRLAPALAREYAGIFGTSAIDIQTANAQFETGNVIRSTISYAVGITLLIVAGFGIYNILNMMIYEKMDTIAILKATGFAGKDVRYIFNMIALSIGIAGGLTGLLLGWGLASAIHHIPFHTSALPTVSTYPVDHNLRFYFIAGTFSVVTTYLAGYFPARKASSIDPVVIIRGK